MINRLARYTFGAYLLQTHQLFRPYLWETLFHFTAVSETSVLYFFEGIVAVVAIFIFTVPLEEGRNFLMSFKPIRNLTEALASCGDNVYRKILSP